MRPLGALCVLVLTVSCASVSPPRTGGQAPARPDLRSWDYPVPEAPLPLRAGPPGREAGASFGPWTVPSGPGLGLLSTQVPGFLLPSAAALPTRQTPVSRSWAPVAQSKAPPLPKPRPPAPAAAKAPAKTAAKPEAKAPATAPAAPVSAPKSPEAPAPSPASTASLLPTDSTSGADYQWQDVNALAGDTVTLHFERTNWLYLDAPSQQKTLGFQSVSREKNAVTFQFRPQSPGTYLLEFQRQDLVNQSTEQRKVRLTVAAAGTRTSSAGTVLAPQTSTQPANDALEASRLLAAAGKTSEAVQKLLQAYRADDTRTNLELGRLLSQGGQDDEALGYLERNLTFTGPDLQATLDLGTRLAAAREPQKRLPAYLKLWKAGTTAPDEELFLQVLETLRTQKMTALAQDWAPRYALWYPAPRHRDRYLFQWGQLLEEPGEGRDVQAAWKAYTDVVKNFPLSPYWKPAGERAAYLNRHFLQVR